MALVIDHHVVPSLITMSDAVDAVADAYAALESGDAAESARSNLLLPNGWIRTMSAALPSSGVIGYKEFHRFSGVSRYAYHLFDANSGEQLAVMDGRHLTALRTGACGGLAVRELSDSGSTRMAVIGTGAEARAQVEAVLTVRAIQEVTVYSRTASNRQAFCSFVEGLAPGIRAIAVDDPALAVKEADIIVVATNTAGSGPAFFGAWLPKRPVHINSVGSTLPVQREIDEEVFARAGQVVIDSRDVLEESGDVLAAERAGTLQRDRVVSLGSILTGAGASLHNPDETSLYKSVGSAIQDIAMAALIYRNAVASSLSLPVLEPFQSVRSVDVESAEKAGQS